MTKRMIGTIAALTLTAAGLQAQGGGVGVGVGVGVGGGVGGGGRSGQFIEQFQQAGTFSAVGVGRSGNMVSANQIVTGRPVSGMEERKSTQKLEDGTMIETSEAQLFFRDSAGRTRSESPKQNRIVIFDPVAHVSINMNTETKTANRMTLPAGTDAVRTAVGVPGTVQLKDFMTSANTVYTIVTDGAVSSTVTTGGPVAPTAVRRMVTGTNENRKHEDLGVESLNGVLATHTRDTLTIPQGQIGNDRDIHVVNDRWYSDDLQMLVKTENGDPRFGKNTYELTNVSRDEPNASLFQVPGDYTVRDVGMGRGVVFPPTVKIDK